MSIRYDDMLQNIVYLIFVLRQGLVNMKDEVKSDWGEEEEVNILLSGELSETAAAGVGVVPLLRGSKMLCCRLSLSVRGNARPRPCCL